MKEHIENISNLIEQYKLGKYSLRQLIYYCKTEFKNDVIQKTTFLPDSCDILERIYYIILLINVCAPVRCKVCGGNARWSGRMNVGYYDTCGNPSCIKKLLNSIKDGKTKISDNRKENFIEMQSQVTVVNDDVIKDLIKYDKYVNLITNTIILEYLDKRYIDSDSRLETVQRIKCGIEEKPKCPTCGNPVKWTGHKNKIFTTYCSDKCAASSNIVKEKKARAQIEKWGERCCYNSKKYQQQCKEQYGVEYHTQRSDIKDKRQATLLEHYETTKLYSVETIRNKIISTNQKKYGCNAYFQSLECCKKINIAMLNNSKYGTSKAENQIYTYLIELGYNVERSYFTEDFPYKCDFYIKSLDLRIEYNGSQYHNKRAFLNTNEDKQDLEQLKEKDKLLCQKSGKAHSQYASVIKTWAGFDVKKRQEATIKNIPYLEIYDCNSKEELAYQLMIYLYCRDKKNPYSFCDELLRKEFDTFKQLHENDLNAVSKSSNYIVKQFQCCSFFKHEMEIYANNPILRRKLIQNRMKYLKKKENELTIDELLTGFKKSGIYYGYSHFNPKLANWFINTYHIKRIYDPCGGWGHHFLGMLTCDKIIYNDFSQGTVDGIVEMKKYFEIRNLEIHQCDASKYIPEDVDAFFMCPPYFNLEHYECGDFKDLDTYKKFLNDIFSIWHMNAAILFGLIIREDLLKYVDDKPCEIFELKCNKSHLNKNKNKNFKEIFCIFAK